MAVKTYSYKKDKSKKLSSHFSVGEFASKSGSTVYSDVVKVDTVILDYLEKLYTVFECTKVIINSGYRTAAHDKAVGGNGNGTHVLGKAVDAVFYGKDGKVIPSWKICCAAQDLGINGVAYISERAVHLDNGGRATAYRGDERYGTNSVKGRDFYSYFGKKKNQVYTMLRPKVSVWDIKGDKIRVNKNEWITFDSLR